MMDEGMQAEIFRAMAHGDFYPHEAGPIEQRETHISKVFLAGKYVYKIKKPKNFGFLDFTTLARRRYRCEREVALNLRLSRDVYLGIVPIVHDGDRLRISGRGRVVEYAVKMRRLPGERAMNRLLHDGEFRPGMLEELAWSLLRFYRDAREAPPGNSLETARANCMENFRQIAPFVGSILDGRAVRFVRDAVVAFLEREQGLFIRREREGRILDCHGDLRTGHIYFHNGVRVIDCIEFNDRFRYSDIAADLAFLAMDLEYEGFPGVARGLITTLARISEDIGLLLLMDFYKCYRALVRVKVNCLGKGDGSLGADGASALKRETDRYMALAQGYAFNFSRPTLWVVCGMIASGKSSVGGRLSDLLGIPLLSSDRKRKEMFHMLPAESAEADFGGGIYAEAATARTYEALLGAAEKELDGGRSVIVDATFARRAHRMKAMAAGSQKGAHTLFVECRAKEAVLRKRLGKREGRASVSDARLRHFDQMRAAFEPLEELPPGSCISINTENPIEENVAEILVGRYEHLSARVGRAGI